MQQGNFDFIDGLEMGSILILDRQQETGMVSCQKEEVLFQTSLGNFSRQYSALWEALAHTSFLIKKEEQYQIWRNGSELLFVFPLCPFSGVLEQLSQYLRGEKRQSEIKKQHDLEQIILEQIPKKSEQDSFLDYAHMILDGPTLLSLFQAGIHLCIEPNLKKEQYTYYVLSFWTGSFQNVSLPPKQVLSFLHCVAHPKEKIRRFSHSFGLAFYETETEQLMLETYKKGEQNSMILLTHESLECFDEKVYRKIR